MPAYTYCTTGLLERVIRCASFNGGHLHSESASHPDVYTAAVVPCEHAARGCSWAILRSANLRYRYPALSPHSARRFLPHLRFPHSGVEDGERAPMRQVRHRGGHACRNVVRTTGAKGAGSHRIQSPSIPKSRSLHGPEWAPRRPHASSSAHLRPRSCRCIRGAGTIMTSRYQRHRSANSYRPCGVYPPS